MLHINGKELEQERKHILNSRIGMGKYVCKILIISVLRTALRLDGFALELR